MTRKATRAVAVVILTASIGTIASVAIYRQVRHAKYIRELSGVVVSVDSAKSRATLEVTDPTTGMAVEFSGEIPANCPISIDGQPATLSDVRVGDKARVKGRVQQGERRRNHVREKRVTTEWVRIARSNSSQPQLAELEMTRTKSNGGTEMGRENSGPPSVSRATNIPIVENEQ